MNDEITTVDALREALSCGWLFRSPNYVELPAAMVRMQITNSLVASAVRDKTLLRRGANVVSNVKFWPNPNSRFDINRWLYRGGNDVRVDHTNYVYPNDIPALDAYAKALTMQSQAAIAARKLANAPGRVAQSDGTISVFSTDCDSQGCNPKSVTG